MKAVIAAPLRCRQCGRQLAQYYRAGNGSFVVIRCQRCRTLNGWPEAGKQPVKKSP